MDKTLFPVFVIQMDATDEDLKTRLQSLEKEELERSSMGDSSKPSASHNNEKDFQRRLQAYKSERKKDEEDLVGRVRVV